MRPHDISSRLPIKMLRTRRRETASVSRLLSTGSFQVVEMATNQNNNHVRSYIMHVHTEKYFANVGRSRLRPNSKFKIEFMFTPPYFANKYVRMAAEFVAHFRMPREVKQEWLRLVHCPQHMTRILEFRGRNNDVTLFVTNGQMAGHSVALTQGVYLYNSHRKNTVCDAVSTYTVFCYVNLCPSG